MSASAFQALVNLANISRASAKGLPAQQDAAARWSGVGFMCMGYRFIIPMGQVKEMMDVPSSTKLPGVSPWVIGLSNVRGRLLPLIDLARFFGGKLTHQKRSHRVLVLESDSIFSGLVVDQCFGMQHFVKDSYGEYQGKAPSTMRKSITGSYLDDSGAPWGVFDLNLLAKDPNFSNAAK